MTVYPIPLINAPFEYNQRSNGSTGLVCIIESIDD